MPDHKRDWKQYNKQLIHRGNINFWITKKSLQSWKAKKRKKAGRPFTYSHEAIQIMLVVRFKYRLSLRELQGFFQYLAGYIGLEKVPSYTQVCRRMRYMDLPKKLMDKKEVTDLVLDTTGLKIYGAGEWCTKRYGGRSNWMKLHLGADLKSRKLVFTEITQEHIHDTACLEQSLKNCNQKKGNVLIDGAADSKRCYAICDKWNKKLLTPPNRRAILRSEKEYSLRNEAVKIIKGLGGDKVARAIWAKLTGYSQRSMIESVISRWKRLLMGRLSSRSLDRIKKEVLVKAMILNRMIDGKILA